MPFATPTFFAYPNEFKTIKTVEWSLEIEHPLGAHDVARSTTPATTATTKPSTTPTPTLNRHRQPLPERLRRTAQRHPRLALLHHHPGADLGIFQLRRPHRRRSVTLSTTTSRASYLTLEPRPATRSPRQRNHPERLQPLQPRLRLWQHGLRHAPKRHRRCHLGLPKFASKPVNWLLGGWTLGGKLYIYSGRTVLREQRQIPGLLPPTTGGSILADLLDPSILGIHCTSVNTRCSNSTQFAASTSTAANPHQQVDFGNTRPMASGAGLLQHRRQLPRNFRSGSGGRSKSPRALSIAQPSELRGTQRKCDFRISGAHHQHGQFAHQHLWTGQGAIVSGRVVVVMARLSF